MLIGVLAASLLTLTIGIVLPLVALATVAVTPLTDRLTQMLVTGQYLTLVGVVVSL